MEQYLVNQAKLKESAMSMQFNSDEALQTMLKQIQDSYDARVLEKRKEEDALLTK